MNRRRQSLWFLVAAALLFAGYRLCQWYLDVRYAVKMDNVPQIAHGMTEKDVEDLLGRPGDYHNHVKRTVAKGETLESEGKVFVGPCEAQATVVDWAPRHGPYVRVAFDGQGKVFSKCLVDYQADASPTFLQKACQWILGF
jgi:hypothetical protein